jgi:hypothetical protein
MLIRKDPTNSVQMLRIHSKPGTVVHAYNVSYLGGRDQEDHSLRPAWAKSP